MNTKRALKWAFIVLCVAVLLVSIVIVSAMVFMGQDFYRALTIRAVEHYTGCNVEIKGDFSLDLSTEPTLEVSETYLDPENPKSSCPGVRIGYLKFQIRPSQLLSKVLYVRQLELRDVTVDYRYGEREVDQVKPSRKGGSLPFLPIVESASLRNIAINLTNADTEYTTRILLQHCTVDDRKNAGPLIISGGGSVDRYGFQIQGELGPLAEILEPTEPFPVDLELKVAESDFQITGTIKDFLDAEGMDLRLSGDVAELSRLVSFFGMEVPPLGQLALRARVRGDGTAPDLSEFSLRLSGVEQVDWSVAGSVSNLLTREGASIDFSGQCSHKELLHLIMPDLAPALETLSLKGTLQEVSGDLVVRALEGYGRSVENIVVNTAGTIRLDDQLTFKGINLSLSATAPNTETLKPYLFDFLPTSGPVTAEAELRSSNGILSLENLKASAEGGSNLVNIHAQGRIGQIPLDERPISDIEMTVSVASTTSDLIASAFELPLPELGKISVQAKVLGSTKEFSLDNLSLLAHHPQGLTSKASGALRFIERDSDDYLGYPDLQVELSAPNMAAVNALLDLDVAPYLAPVEAQGHMSGTTEKLSVKNILVKLGHGGPLSFDFQGNIDTISIADNQEIDGLDIRASMNASSIADLSRLLGHPISDTGPIKGSGRIVSRKGSLAVNDLTVVLDSGKEFYVKATGSIDSLQFDGDIPFEGLTAKITASGEKANALTSLVDLPFPDFGPFQAEADFSYRDGYIAVTNLMLAATGEKGQSLLVEATGKTEPRYNRSTVTATFSASTKPFMDVLLGRPVAESHTVKGSAQITFTPDNVSVEKFTVASEDLTSLAIHAKGNIRAKDASYETDLAISSNVGDISFVESLLGRELPQLPPASVTGKLRGTPDNLAFDGKMRSGESDLNVSLARTTKQDKPHLLAKLSASRLALADFGIYPEYVPDEPASLEKKKASLPANLQVFSDTPLPFEKLRDLNFSFHLDVDELEGKNVSFRDCHIALTLEDGRLHISPLTLTYAKGSTSGDATVDVTTDKPEVIVKVTAEDIDIGALLAHVHNPLIAKGDLTFVLDVNARGNSPYQLTSTLNGELAMAIENGRSLRALDYLAPDATDLVNTIRSTKDYVDLNCFLMRFLFKDGVGTSQVLWSDSAYTTIRGAGTIDLKKEEVDIVLNPKQKKKKFGLSSPARIRGPLRNPSIRKIPAKEAANLAAEILMPYVFLPARGAGYLYYLIKKDKGAPCVFEEK